MKNIYILPIGLIISGLLTFWDNEISRLIYNTRSNFGEIFFENITRLNNPSFNVMSFVIFTIYFLFKHKDYYNKILLVNGLGSAILSPTLKNIFSRARPEIENRLVEVSGYSFPSGHALASVTIWGFCGWYLSQRFNSQVPLFFAGLLIGLVSYSRVYLGVHYMSDVVAGVTIGLCWLFFSINIIPKIPKTNL